MRYFFQVNGNPLDPNYELPEALYRWEVGDKLIISERWSSELGGWVHDPRMIAWTGIGGDNDYVETTQVDADAFRERTTVD